MLLRAEGPFKENWQNVAKSREVEPNSNEIPENETDIELKSKTLNKLMKNRLTNDSLDVKVSDALRQTASVSSE